MTPYPNQKYHYYTDIVTRQVKDQYGNVYPGDGTVLYPLPRRYGDGRYGVLRKWPTDPENPGKVSEGTAKQMANVAEVHHTGGHQGDLAKLRFMGERPSQMPERQRNRRRRQRAARRA